MKAQVYLPFLELKSLLFYQVFNTNIARFVSGMKKILIVILLITNIYYT